MRHLTAWDDGAAFTPILQIIHLSDPHFGPARPAIAAIGRQAANTLGDRIGAWIAQRNHGFAGHDRDALVQLEAILARIVGRTRLTGHRFERCPFRVVVTGDLSTWGDAPSIVEAMGRLTELATSVGVHDPPIFIYGNHDVWPGVPGRLEGFPLFARNETLDAKRSQLRDPQSGLFPETWPRHFAQHTFPITASDALTVHSLNTVIHGRVENALAQGHVGADRYWEGAGADEQHAIVAQDCAPGVRILLTHHPIHHPGQHELLPPMPVGGGAMVGLSVDTLTNATAVACALSLPQPGGAPEWHRRVQVVLSGHTHETFPPFGLLDVAPTGRDRHAPLEDHQVQLIAASTCQSGWTPAPRPQEWQLLRFSFFAGEHARADEGLEERRGAGGAVLRIERSVFTRSARVGKYVARALASGETFERLDLALR